MPAASAVALCSRHKSTRSLLRCPEIYRVPFVRPRPLLLCYVSLYYLALAATDSRWQLATNRGSLARVRETA
jgi:hypothetical protein